MEEFSSDIIINTFSRGYHEYMSVWMLQIGDNSLFCRREYSSEYDKYDFPCLASCKVTGTRITRGIGAGLEIPIEITFFGKETATKWLKKVLYRINMMIEEKVLKCKK